MLSGMLYYITSVSRLKNEGYAHEQTIHYEFRYAGVFDAIFHLRAAIEGCFLPSGQRHRFTPRQQREGLFASRRRFSAAKMPMQRTPLLLTFITT